ncbi:ribbon-helix-helix protein, CopG family [Streptomyces sp. NPDC057702]|uniref:ribbon-helix-helix protein, CopG family n=1 Tax=unclassified Streptomyces TaxID=2593676 RepID=UPI00368001CA
MGSTVLSLRIDGELLDRMRQHAARRGMSVQEYVVRTLVREDFDERFHASVDETAAFYAEPGTPSSPASPH